VVSIDENGESSYRLASRFTVDFQPPLADESD
jgi:hypothetical protein